MFSVVPGISILPCSVRIALALVACGGLRAPEEKVSKSDSSRSFEYNTTGSSIGENDRKVPQAKRLIYA